GSNVPCCPGRATERYATLVSDENFQVSLVSVLHAEKARFDRLRRFQMRKKSFPTLVVYTALAAVSFFSALSIAQTPAPAPPAPIMPPSLPPTHLVDLMTARGSAAFGAQWKTMEAKIVNVKPIPDAL